MDRMKPCGDNEIFLQFQYSMALICRFTDSTDSQQYSCCTTNKSKLAKLEFGNFSTLPPTFSLHCLTTIFVCTVTESRKVRSFQKNQKRFLILKRTKCNKNQPDSSEIDTKSQPNFSFWDFQKISMLLQQSSGL